VAGHRKGKRPCGAACRDGSTCRRMIGPDELACPSHCGATPTHTAAAAEARQIREAASAAGAAERRTRREIEDDVLARLDEALQAAPPGSIRLYGQVIDALRRVDGKAADERTAELVELAAELATAAINAAADAISATNEQREAMLAGMHAHLTGADAPVPLPAHVCAPGPGREADRGGGAGGRSGRPVVDVGDDDVIDAEIVDEDVAHAFDERCDCDACGEEIERQIRELNAEAARIEASLQPVRVTTWIR
jgi:hypothetical protein